MLLLRYPRIVEYPLEHLRARLQFFTDLGFTRAQLEKVSCPSALCAVSPLHDKDDDCTVDFHVLTNT